MMLTGLAFDAVRIMYYKSCLQEAGDIAALTSMEYFENLILEDGSTQVSVISKKIDDTIDYSRKIFKLEIAQNVKFIPDLALKMSQTAEVSLDKNQSEKGYKLLFRPSYEMPLSGLSFGLKALGMKSIVISTDSVVNTFNQSSLSKHIDDLAISIHADVTNAEWTSQDKNKIKDAIYSVDGVKFFLKQLARSLKQDIPDVDKHVYAGVSEFGMDTKILTWMQHGTRGISSATSLISVRAEDDFPNIEDSLARTNVTLTGKERLHDPMRLIDNYHIMILRNKPIPDYYHHSERFIKKIEHLCHLMSENRKNPDFTPLTENSPAEGTVRIIVMGISPHPMAAKIGKLCATFQDDYYEAYTKEEIEKQAQLISNKLVGDIKDRFSSRGLVKLIR
ncbi:hypothetical protein [Candidatus Liberibacter sp.]|uniref:hypothetical protein n=1 Tax=Candidatus Liberibacter sp. TaxID=34022 RepID=UPI0015F6A2CE|nr:hypothetical protein [Candidatus Liberibacter sp.]MBA5723732.1 hypothetical protein [Candidatus Liberibacter sp.]